ncbi:hypothetical protein BDV95DRAFT_565353 [Massariosphaeria phaeospora]|uniref:BTB domain-containing protein n=1 Tax=Massariosphaeria phaeospora TaxID=100035 RepID=A0A7C8MBJ5_9PLEO|nr:hypothetical protein BDV95DRAFT_565353 [Massariosphaeria phaeospora]
MSTKPPPAKKLRRSAEDGPCFSTSVITVRVGKPEQLFTIHESLLRSSSFFFDSALKDGWKENEQKAISLPSVIPEIFTVYVKWLYTGQFFLTRDGDDRVVKDDATGKILKRNSTEWWRWKACYELADFIQDSDFKDACVDVALELMKSIGYCMQMGNLIYHLSVEGSPARKFAVDIAVCKFRVHGFEELAKKGNSEYIGDVMVALAKAKISWENPDNPMEVQDTCVLFAVQNISEFPR